jgi:hypothetical protein
MGLKKHIPKAEMSFKFTCIENSASLPGGSSQKMKREQRRTLKISKALKQTCKKVFLKYSLIVFF